MKKMFVTITAVLMTLIFGVSAFAALPTAEELSYLKEYGIFEGDADGELRLDDNVKRSEAAKMICTAMCMQARKDVQPPFPDIFPGNWAIGWIDIAKAIGIVKGDENGNFRPDDTVTNEEYIKMLVCALGYEPMAEQRGGYPAGYMAVANSRGITEGMEFDVNVAAKRGDIAVMTYKALDVPLMCQTGFGSQVEYTVMSGEAGTDLRTLRLELDPDWEYPIEEEADSRDEKNPEDNAFEKVYSYEDVEIENLKKKNGTYTFSDKKRGGSERIYVVDSDTYVHMNDGSVPLSAAKDGMFARVLCTIQEGDNVEVLGIEIYEINPNTSEE